MNLAELRQAVAPLASVGSSELSFEFEGIPIKIRTLTPEEEIAVFRYARSVVADGDATDRATGLEYLDRFRIATLSYAITRVAGVDFTGMEYVETGEKLPNGTPVRVTKPEALMETMKGWSREMMTTLFARFGDLQFQVEDRLSRAVSFDEVDYEGEIARLEERLTELREQKTRREAASTDPRSEAVVEAARRPTRARKAPEAPKGEAVGPAPEDFEAPEPQSVAQPLDVPKELDAAPPVSVFGPAVRRADAPAPSSPVEVKAPAAEEVPQEPEGTLDAGPIQVDTTPPPAGFQTSFGPSPEPLSVNSERRAPLPLRPPHVSAFTAYQEASSPAAPETPPPPAARTPAPPPGIQTRFRPATKST